jgi:hypothetical protein
MTIYTASGCERSVTQPNGLEINTKYVSDEYGHDLAD